MLHQLRWRKAPPNRGRRWLALGIVLVLHGLFGWLTWHEMQLGKLAERAREERTGALLVRLIPRAPTAPAPTAAPELAPPPAPAPPPPPVNKPVVHEAPAKNAMTVSLPPAPPAPASPSPASPPEVENVAGQAAPAASASAATPAPEGDYVRHMPQGDAKIMQHSTPVPYQATRFEKDWQKRGGSSVDDALQKGVDKSTVSHTFHVAPGVRIHCSVSLLALGGGCGGDPPPPPPSNDGDMRMNMAPASQLAPGSPAPQAISVAECIAIYRAEKPLPQGCPVDTPTRSVDAEMEERAALPAPQDGG